jgi:hypothetical protein
MVIHWIPLIIGLCFGLMPPRMLIKGECRYLMFEELWTKALWPEDKSVRRRRWWKMPLVWIDPLRGYAVAMYIVEAFPKPPSGSTLSPYPMMAAAAVVMMTCLRVQASGRQHVMETISPTSFLTGMLLVVLPYEVSIPTIIVGAATIVAVRDYLFGYVAAVLCCAGFGYMFMGFNLSLLTPMALIILPLWVNWQQGTRLVVPVRC